MPHLSPMSWLLMMPLLWMTLILLMSTSYFTTFPHFMSPKTHTNLVLKTQWSWSLQDGRD